MLLTVFSLLCGTAIANECQEAFIKATFSSPQNFETAFRVCSKRAQKGDIEAMGTTSFLYEHGKGTQKNLQKSLMWSKKAAELGHAQSQANLGLFYVKGEGGVKQNQDEAIKWFRKAADQGNAAGQYLLGLAYEFGSTSTVKNIDVAKDLYTKAADQGHEKARERLQYLQ